MVPSSSEDVTRAMRGLPKGFSRKLQMFSALSAVFLFGWASFALCSLAVRYFAVYSEFNKQTSTATATSTMAV